VEAATRLEALELEEVVGAVVTAAADTVAKELLDMAVVVRTGDIWTILGL
jgi:hypothetical protein